MSGIGSGRQAAFHRTSFLWLVATKHGNETIRALPAEHAGKCVLGANGRLFVAEGAGLTEAADTGTLAFHEGSIKGALPQVLRAP